MAAKKYKMVDRKVSDLIPYVNNSRVHDEEQIIQICSSIKEFGFTNPVLIDEENGIIAGHGRLMAAKKLNLKTVPCIVLAGLSEAQKKAYVIADNSIALNSSWNMDVLSREVEALQAEDFDLNLLGFKDDFMVSLFDDPAPEPEQKPNGEEYTEIFNILVECDNEAHQQEVYDELTQKGLKCRVQSL
ncbi:ParB N-terminal domain-containing protein [Salinisphaera sp. G21_0]|uniref:ParB/Srx family N-terminal domain-containing protein n=1 Tax=Salinisphaera sp. G21_0 TaxID=2821094 RepID=UPI001AD999BF|nr:ParB N-terminal domain-containing protein [Salinisphaera sp. G21_0]MBO9484129.1 ParB N-terminal domain-containing protein [Salinisphaera sp. G21_0]